MNRQDAKNAKDAKDAKRTEPDAGLDMLAQSVVDAAMDVHRVLGPGYLESVYEEALILELSLRGLNARRQVPVDVHYRGFRIGQARLDMLVADRLIVELKSVERLLPLHVAQLVSYLKATRQPLGLLINFNTPILKQGIRRVIHTP